jgi:hypothetical protein
MRQNSPYLCLCYVICLTVVCALYLGFVAQLSIPALLTSCIRLWEGTILPVRLFQTYCDVEFSAVDIVFDILPQQLSHFHYRSSNYKKCLTACPSTNVVHILTSQHTAAQHSHKPKHCKYTSRNSINSVSLLH